jgi:DNA polymerase III delta prime subunit
MNFIGNAKIISILDKAIKKDNLSHAYLFSGPEFLGKAKLAKIFAKSIIGKKDFLDFSLELGSEFQMDLILVEAPIVEKKGIIKKKKISTEQIREVQSKLSLYPYSGAYKVLIINDAHLLTTSAQNSLLKTLEEPNKTSVLILVTSEVSRILPTIRSRVQSFNFSLASDDEILKESGGKFLNEEEEVLFSMGRPGILKALLEDKLKIADFREQFSLLLRIKKEGLNEKMKIAEKISKDKIHLLETLSFWLWIIRKKIEKNSKEEIYYSYDLADKIEKSMEILKTTNANTRLVLENLFLSI